MALDSTKTGHGLEVGRLDGYVGAILHGAAVARGYEQSLAEWAFTQFLCYRGFAAAAA